MNSLKGAEAGRYYTDRLPSYYLDGEEPPGRWWGRGAGRLGLHDQVDPEAFLAVLAGQDLWTRQDLGRRFGEGSVRGYDATFSAPKSVSVLFAVGDDQVREQVIEAHDGAVDAVLGWVEDDAHTRVRRHGHVMHVDAGGLVVGLFRQHTSRRLDPQLHPAGAGKTTMLAKAKLNLAIQGRKAFGVAPTAAAAEVLAGETRMRADTLDKLLIEHAHLSRPANPEFDLPAGTTVIVDEASTASTPKLAALFRLADQHDWRIILVGDPRQFAAVGRGGMFAHLVDSHGAVELDQVHRFGHMWERQASLDLRTGDPAALIEYDRRGRLHDGTLEQMETDIIAAWHEARSRGDTVALMASKTETVIRLNQLAQESRVKAKELDLAGPSLRVGETSILVGDEVVTRRNDRTLRTDRRLMVKNRDHWTITDVHRDRSVTLAGRTGVVQLPAEYVSEHLELGYAQTSHATQGRTVDVGLLLVDSPIDSRGVYTPMTRGREANHAYVVTEDNQTSLDVLTQALARDWIDQPAVARRRIAERQERKRRIERTLGRGL